VGAGVEVTDDTRREIVREAVRWASNIVIEVTSNHHNVLTPAQREALRRAVKAMADFRDETDAEMGRNAR
jgi:protein-tyrosine-phosphatase